MTPIEMDAVEGGRRRDLIRAEARDHERLAGENEGNVLRFAEPGAVNSPKEEEDNR